MKTHRLIKLLIVTGFGILCSACSNTFLASLNAATRLNTDFEKTNSIAYGSESWQQLDVYSPKITTPKKRPVLVFFYGGGWTAGRKEQYMFVADAFVRRGYVVVLPDYIKYPQGQFPQFIQDGAKALAWVEQHIGDYGGDAKQVFIAGHSAGAHLAAMLATDQHYLHDAGVNPRLIRGMAGIAGPYNFTPEKDIYKNVFASPDNYPAMQVANFIDSNTPPLWLAIGGKDSVVGQTNVDILLAKLKQQAMPYQFVRYDSRSHATILLAIARLLEGDTPIVDDMDTFFRAVLAQPTAH